MIVHTVDIYIYMVVCILFVVRFCYEWGLRGEKLVGPFLMGARRPVQSCQSTTGL